MKTDFASYVKSKREAADERWLGLAIEASGQAMGRGDRPQGAVLALPTRYFVDWDTRASERSKLAHAEMNVLRKAEASGADLSDGVLYCAKEPCLMCATAAVTCGVKQIIFGAHDLAEGFASVYGLAERLGLSWKGGVLAEEYLSGCHQRHTDQSLREDSCLGSDYHNTKLLSRGLHDYRTLVSADGRSGDVDGLEARLISAVERFELPDGFQ